MYMSHAPTMTHPGSVFALKVKPRYVFSTSNTAASAGPTAIPSALALTNPADAFRRVFVGTQSLIYRRLTALADPNLAMINANQSSFKSSSYNLELL